MTLTPHSPHGGTTSAPTCPGQHTQSTDLSISGTSGSTCGQMSQSGPSVKLTERDRWQAVTDDKHFLSSYHMPPGEGLVIMELDL